MLAERLFDTAGEIIFRHAMAGRGSARQLPRDRGQGFVLDHDCVCGSEAGWFRIILAAEKGPLASGQQSAS